MEFSGKTAVITVGIANRNGRNFGGCGGDVGAAVADGSAGRYILDIGNTAEPFQRRTKGQGCRICFSTWIHSVERNTGTNHIVMVRKMNEAGRIVHMADGNVQTTGFKQLAETVKARGLNFGTTAVSAVSGCKVAENAFNV